MPQVQTRHESSTAPWVCSLFLHPLAPTFARHVSTIALCVSLCTFGRGTARADDAQGTPTQSRVSPSILVYEDNSHFRVRHLSQVMPACISHTNLIVHIKLSPDRNSLSHTHTRSLPRRHTEPAAREHTPHHLHTTGFPQIPDKHSTRGSGVQ